MMKKLLALLAILLLAPIVADAQIDTGIGTSSTLFSQTQAVTVVNTTNELTLVGTGSGSVTIPPNFFTAGKVLRFEGIGIHSAAAAPTIRLRVYFGNTVMLDTTAVTTGNSTNNNFRVFGLITCYTTGATGTFWAQGMYMEEATAANIFSMANTGTIQIDTTAAQVVNLTAQWGAQSNSDAVTLTNFTIEALK